MIAGPAGPIQSPDGSRAQVAPHTCVCFFLSFGCVLCSRTRVPVRACVCFNGQHAQNLYDQPVVAVVVVVFDKQMAYYTFYVYAYMQRFRVLSMMRRLPSNHQFHDVHLLPIWAECRACVCVYPIHILQWDTKDLAQLFRF